MYPVAEISLQALKHNYSRVKDFAPNSKVMSVIKANAYGHGDIEAAKALHKSDAFAVARLSEGIRLRDAGIAKPIVLLDGVHSKAQCQQASEYSLSPVFHHHQQIQWLSELRLAKPLLFCWLMVETGMHRLGFTPDKINDAVISLKNTQNIEGEVGLMSHFANGDRVGDERNAKQQTVLTHVMLGHTGPISMASSAAIMSLSDSHHHWVRPGLMLYGASPFGNQTAQSLNLKPVMTTKAQLISVDQLQVGDEVGYGGTWYAKDSMRVGIVNMGYGDGYSRLLSNVGYVSLHNQAAKVLGRVSMDMICIDLSELDNAKIGDEVILWGDEIVPVDQLAKQANTISYEILCQLNQRVMRHYHG
ncbi:MAG: alanine racemase [Methylophagaceae bacterium]|jgi:alanine racemase